MISVFFSLLLALPPTIAVSDIQPGATGECLTVFQGHKVEPMPFTVRGLMPNFLGPGQDVVVIRLNGEKAEFTGVVSGMSGSPCLINGRLVGALAYAFAQFAKEPIAGITPIASMHKIMQLPQESRPWRISHNESMTDWRALRHGDTPNKNSEVNNINSSMAPIATPLSISGFTPELLRHFSPWLEANGFMPMAAGSSSRLAKPYQLKPGSAVAAVLVRGDVEIAATGTVTSVEGKQVLAFGHPFFGAGAVSLPMANAEIINTMASTMRSFKMSTTGAVIGEVTQDRLTGIGGYLGRQADMIKVNGQIITPGGNKPFSFEVARDQGLSPRLMAMALANCFAGRIEASRRGILKLNANIAIAGHESLAINDIYSSEHDMNLMVYPAIDVAQAFDLIWNSPFNKPPKISLNVQAEFVTDPVEESVESIHLDRSFIRPGDQLKVIVRLYKKGSGISQELFEITIPNNWANEEIEIIAAGATEVNRVLTKLAGDAKPENLSDIIKGLSQRRADGNLYLLVTRAGAGLHSRVDMLPFLPPSIVATMSGAQKINRRDRGLAWEDKRARLGTVSGIAQVKIEIQDRK
ncbi:MAG: hypothetical protein JW841_13565 [Deltaproteobacteria bacterium]|nr:hypothetical protein [Deltaproteobacteria bacterium]